MFISSEILRVCELRNFLNSTRLFKVVAKRIQVYFFSKGEYDLTYFFILLLNNTFI